MAESFRMGFGAMRLPTEPAARSASIALARQVVDLGVTLIDTAYMYGWGANEELLAEALHPYPPDLLITTKVGIAGNSMKSWALDTRPDSLRRQVEAALRRLRVERLELLQLHRIDPAVPLADQLGALRELQEAGKIGRLGLSEVSVAELAAAREIIDVTSVQNRYNILEREYDAVLDACTDAGITFLPWRPVAPPAQTPPAELTAVAGEVGATVAQVSLAWLLHRSAVMVPIPGTASATHLAENVAAAELHLNADQQERLDRIPE